MLFFCLIYNEILEYYPENVEALNGKYSMLQQIKDIINWFVGKTTLVNRYLTKVFDEDIKMTVGADFYVKELEIDGKKDIIKIWVFGGEKCFKVLLPSFARFGFFSLILRALSSSPSR